MNFIIFILYTLATMFTALAAPVGVIVGCHTGSAEYGFYAAGVCAACVIGFLLAIIFIAIRNYES